VSVVLGVLGFISIRKSLSGDIVGLMLLVLFKGERCTFWQIFQPLIPIIIIVVAG
jgi:hypothetical protein